MNNGLRPSDSKEAKPLMNYDQPSGAPDAEGMEQPIDDDDKD